MKVVLIYGDDTVKLQNRLQTFISTAKARNWEIVYLHESGRSLGESLSAGSLFPKDQLLIYENVKSLTKNEIAWLKNNTDRINGTLVLIQDGDLTKSFISGLPKPEKQEVYRLPQYIWNFLESFYPGNSRNTIQLFHKVIEKEPPELIFALLAKQVRDLYLVSQTAALYFTVWKNNKLKAQQRKFKDRMLQKILNELAEIDIAVKSSKSDLVSSIDFLILTEIQ